MKSEKIERIYKSIMMIAITSFITFIVTLVFAYKTIDKNMIDNVRINSDGDSNFSQLVQTMKLFKEQLEKEYIYELDDKKMMESALKGYVEGVGDEYTEYFTKEEVQEFMESTNGKYSGIGVYISQTEDGEVLVLGPLSNSPAEEAGIKTGDIITKIDGVECKGKKLDENADSMKGETGTKVKLEIRRGEETLNFELTRRTIVVSENTVELLENNIAYIQLVTFGEDTAADLKNKIEELKEKNDLKGVILDLRNNGGGVVDESLKIADFFVDKDKTLLITKSKKDEEEVEKSKTDKLLDMPVVILTNEYTASASEILAGALKDNLDCTIVGTNTYGKGVIQVFRELNDGSALKITISEYFTPNHNEINKKGIKPDIEIQLESGSDEDVQLQKAIETLKSKM